MAPWKVSGELRAMAVEPSYAGSDLPGTMPQLLTGTLGTNGSAVALKLEDEGRDEEGPPGDERRGPCRPGLKGMAAGL